MNRSAWSRRFAVAVTVLAVGYWLFADTVAYYSPGARDPSVICFAHFGTYQDYETWKTVIAAFEAQNPGIAVRQEYVSGWYGLYNAKIREQMLAGDLPHVMLMQVGPFQDLAEGFADLTAFIESEVHGIDLSQLDGNGVRSFLHRGRPYGLPVSGGNLLIYCNPDCFERAAAFRGRPVHLPPDDWTLGDFRALAEALTCDFDGDGQPDQFGFWQPQWVYYLPFLWSFGADVLDSAGTHWRLTGSEAEAAFTFYQDMRYRDRISPHPYETAQIMQDVGFLTGKVAMCVNGPWFQPFLAETKLADRYHVAHIPTGPAGRQTRVTWDGLCLARGRSTEEQDHAWRFIRFVCAKRAQDLLARTQRALPARVESTPAFCEGDGGRRSGKFVEALAYSRLQPVTPFFPEMDRVINRHLQRLLDATHRPDARRFLADLANDPVIVRRFSAPEALNR